jgi:Recombination endonuclease VII
MPGAGWVGWPGSRSCQKCRQPVTWVLTKNGRWVPINPEPAEDGQLAITDGDPPTVRHLWYDMQAEEHEWLAVCHVETCQHGPGPTKPRSSPEKPRARTRRELRHAVDRGYEPGPLSGHPGRCEICGGVTEELVTDHCHRHGQARGDVCKLCNSRLAKADAALWRGDVEEIHSADLDHLRHCGQCARELDYILAPQGQTDLDYDGA